MRSQAILVCLLAACTANTSKQDISEAPFDAELDDNAKDDSPTRPTKGIDIRVAQLAEGKFSGTAGFIGHTIALTGGRVDVDLTGIENGEPLDTILYVFGPRRDNGTYPRRAIAFNDDFEPGVNLGSHIVLDVPADGLYKVVVSTYDNYINFPFHVSRGEYRLMVKCQDPTFGACGPAVSGLDGACWADEDCLATDGTPLHCEGEVTCAPGTQCFFVRQGTCVADYAWMTFAARQCTNPWDAAQLTEEEANQFPIRDLAAVKKHYGKQGVTFDELGQLTQPEPPFVCLACGCPRGDEIVVKVSTPEAELLAADGWIYSSPLPEAVSLEPKQCGSNPWQTTQTSSVGEELELVDTWLANENARVTKRGFAYSAEPRAVCESCACPRGDRLIAFPLDQEDAGLLSSLGFSAVYVP